MSKAKTKKHRRVDDKENEKLRAKIKSLRGEKWESTIEVDLPHDVREFLILEEYVMSTCPDCGVRLCNADTDFCPKCDKGMTLTNGLVARLPLVECPQCMRQFLSRGGDVVHFCPSCGRGLSFCLVEEAAKRS